jgi:hypothetical protein
VVNVANMVNVASVASVASLVWSMWLMWLMWLVWLRRLIILPDVPSCQNLRARYKGYSPQDPTPKVNLKGTEIISRTSTLQSQNFSTTHTSPIIEDNRMK